MSLGPSLRIGFSLAWLMALTQSASAGERADARYPFEEVWRQVRARSRDIVAASEELEAAHLHEARLSRHYYPRIFASGKVFETNDPALSFMSLLGQRQIAAADFAPSALNEPGNGFFERLTLGVELSLYEGGAKSALVDASRKTAEARAYDLSAVERARYAELASDYSSLLALERQREELATLAEGVAETLSRYHIGAKSNPVGYSGLLGLKNLRNRLEGLLLENAAKARAIRGRIRSVARELPASWQPVPEDPRRFIAAHLEARSGAERPPATVLALRASAEALESERDVEKARFLPKLGVFGTGDLYGGSRAAATSYTAGAYLQWDLLSAPDIGAVAQAGHEAAAAEARAEAMSARVESEREASLDTAESLDKSLALMDESARLLEEQTVAARALFRNGSITALQLVEVLARRADLMVNRTDSQLALARARSAWLVSSGAEGGTHAR